jgi:hypothetical protein
MTLIIIYVADSGEGMSHSVYQEVTKCLSPSRIYHWQVMSSILLTLTDIPLS